MGAFVKNWQEIGNPLSEIRVQRSSCLDGDLPVKRPQEGQPFLKSDSSPTNLQKGQRTVEKRTDH